MRAAHLALASLGFAFSALAPGCGSADSRSYDYSENGRDTQSHQFPTRTQPTALVWPATP